MITCPITQLPLENFYKYVYRSIKDKLDANKTFDIESFIDDFYKEAEKNSDKENAAKWVQSAPRVINLILTNTFSDKLDKVKGLENIYKLMADFAKPGKEGLNNVLDRYKKEVPENLNAVAAKQIEIEFSTDEVEEPEEEKNPSQNEINRLKTVSVTSGTFPIYLPVDPKKKTDKYVERLDEPRAQIIEKLSVLDNAFLMQGGLGDFKYQNRIIKIKATNLYAFSQTDFNLLDPTTQREIKDSNFMVNSGRAQGNVTQTNKRVILVISDEFGQTLYFDEEGNITDKSKGKPIYQFMRDVRKTGKGFTVTDIYGKEDQLMPVDVYAKQTYNAEIDGDYATYLEQVKDQRNKDLKELYNIREEALAEDVLLDFDGVSTGVSSEATKSKMSLSDLIKQPDGRKVLKTIQTLKKAKGRFKKGRAIIKLNGNTFQVNRATMPQEVADQVAAVMFNPNLSFEAKLNFYSQFIPEDSTSKMSYTMRKHEIIPDKKTKSFIINLYANTGTENGFVEQPEFVVPITETSLAKATDEQLQKGIATFSKTLMSGQKNGDPTFITYKSELLNSEDYLVYNPKTNDFKVSNYIDFISKLDGVIDIIDVDPGFYNKHMLFSKPNNLAKQVQKARENAEIGSFEQSIMQAQQQADENLTNTEKEAQRIVNYALSDDYKSFIKSTGINAKADSYFITSYLVNQINQPNGYTKESAEELVDLLSSKIQSKQVQVAREAIAKLYPSVNTAAAKQVQVIQKTVEPEMPDPTRLPTKSGLKGRFGKSGSLDRKGYLADEIGESDADKVLDWWNNSKFGKELQKHIELEHAYNLVNSDVFAKFIVSGATLAGSDKIAKIQINPNKGTLVDIYHEAWHAFSQLYLTRQEKYDLYSEVQEFTDKNGNTPYASMSYKEIDEMLAEDFRTYMKSNYIKTGSPVKNKLFRKILNFLRSLFGLKPINPTEVVTDVMNVPAVREMFEKLNYSSNKKTFVRSYQANIANVDFFELDRGAAKVDNPSESALSKQDSNLISNSMDMIISDIIDDYFNERLAEARETGNYTSLKSGTVGLLLDPEERGITYEVVKERLEEKLDEFKSKLHRDESINVFSKINTLEELQNEAVAVLKTTDNSDKYVFLQSQMDGFDKVTPEIKKGTRVRGESWHGIKIVGDFYSHKTIEEKGKPVNILVVSNLEDAQVQLDNYIKGGAKNYIPEIELKDVPEFDLSAEQELILDNIRILQAAIDNYGDPQWDSKGSKPSGMIAYHLEHSSFDIGSAKYYLDKDMLDAEGEEIDEDEENQTHDSETPFGGEAANKKSILQLASKEVIYLLKSLHKVNREGDISYNRLGFKEPADFKKIWGIIVKNIGGIRDRQKVYEILEKESKNFPELKQLIETKLPNPKGITNLFEQKLSNSFWQTFAKPSIKYWQFTVFPQYGQTINLFGDVDTKITGFESEVTESSLAVDSTIRRFEALFKSSTPNKYISKTDKNQAILNLENVVFDFQDKKYLDQLDIKKSMQFAAALGIKLDTLDPIKNNLQEKSEYYGLPYIYDIVKDFYQIQQNPEATSKQKDFLAKFIANPIGVLRTEIPKGILESFEKDVAEKNILKRIAELQLQYGYENANPAVLLPDGNKVYENVNHSQVTVTVDALNTVENLSDLWTDPKYGYMSHFKPGKSFFTLRSKVIGALFDTTNESLDKKGDKALQLIQTSGTQIAGLDGITTADLDKTGKLFQEVHTFGLNGIAEFMRHAEKKSAFGIRQIGSKMKVVVNGITNGVDQNLYIDLNKFNSKNADELTPGEIVAVGGYFLDYIAVEFDRIRYFKQNPTELKNIIGYNREVGKKKDGSPLLAGEVFTAFDNILTTPTKNKLYKLVSNSTIDLPTYIRSNQDLYLDIQKDIVDYFKEKAESLYRNEFTKLSYVDDQLYEKAGIDPKGLNSKNQRASDLILLKGYLYNSWIHKFEMFSLINGDAAQFDHDKEAASKRVPGSTSDGDPFLNDEYMHDFVNNVLNKKTYASKLAKELEDDTVNQFVMDGALNTGVIADAERLSVYLDDMLDAWEEKYYADLSPIISNPKKLKQEVDKKLAKDAKAYKKMVESDGAAFMTFDAYRTLRFMNDKWSTAQEALYQQIINGEEIDPKKVKEFFPVYKLHYYGSIANAPIATTGMHKFAVTPIIPTLAKPGTKLYDLHLKMLKSNMQYYAFGSGSKVSTLTMDGTFDNIFEPGSDEKAVSADAPVKINKIYLEYLKDVTAINTKFKGEISYPTQKRVLLLDGLFNVGEVADKHKEIAAGYKSAVDDYTEILTLELLNKIGYEYDPKTETYTGQIDKFIELIREELGAREVPEHLITLLDTRVTGNLSMDFSIHPEADTLEKIIVNRIQKSVIKQKTKGEALIQAPSTFYNGIWDSEYERDQAIKKNDELIKKYLGSNNLPFYRTTFNEDGSRGNSMAMKIAITLHGDFLNLLNIIHPDGEKIGNVDRLNDLIKNDEWLEKNRELITIAGPRIPTDADNTIEFAEVWHFIDPSYGNIVIVPTEIVAKAGSDFDVDKISFMLPNLNSDGTIVGKVAESMEELKAMVKKANGASFKQRKNKEFRSAGSLISQYKKYAQNELIRQTAKILSLPEKYATLTKPNNTYLVEDEVSFYQENSSIYNPKVNAHNEAERLNAAGDKTVMSPSRIFDEEYNLSVHEKNLSGNLPLGIMAKKNKVHSLFKSVGAVMPASYKATIWNDEDKKYDELDIDYDVVMPIAHQTTTNSKGQTVVSLSHQNNIEGEKIGDIFSHGLQGLLDRAKNPFPFILKIIKEALPTINHLIESGAKVSEVFAFVNNPWIARYIDNQVYLGGSTAKLMDNPVASHQVKAAAARLTINEMVKQGLSEKTVKELAKYANSNRLADIIGVLKKQDLNTKYTFVLSKNGELTQPMSATGKRIFKSKDFPLGDLVELKAGEEGVSYADQKKYFTKSFGIANNDNFYYAGQAAWKMAFGSENKVLTESELKTYVKEGMRPTIQNLAILMRMIQLEKQFSGMDALEMAFTPDTGMLDTVLHVKKRDEALSLLSEVSKVDSDFLNRLRYKSILSSFYKSDMILNLTNPLFALRLNDTISNYIDKVITKNKDSIAQKYGVGIKGQERFTNTFNNAVVNYIFQNTMSNYTDKNGRPVTLPEEVHTYPVNEVSQGPAITLTDKGYQVNLAKLQNDYASKIFLSNNNSPDSYSNTDQDTFDVKDNPFPTFESYVKFAMEKAYFKSAYPEATDSYLTQRALISSFNHAFIMGTTKYSYTDMVMNIISEFEDQNIKYNYPVLAQLAPAKFEKDVNVLELNDKGTAKGDTATEYYKNLKQLADPTVRKVKDKADNKRISDVFKNFSMLMFYQHGVGYSKLGFTKILDPEAFIAVMENASGAFLANDVNAETLDRIYTTMNATKSSYKNYTVDPFASVAQTSVQSFLEGLSDDELAGMEDFMSPGTVLRESPSKVLEGDIFSLPGIPVITTNLGGVHGAGLAQAAKAKGLIKQGDGTFKATDKVVQLPVKKVWSDSMAMNNNMDLLKESLRSLIMTARGNADRTYLLPLAGLGHGEGSVEEIMPLLIKTVQASDNIKLVIPAEGVNLGRQGTVRKDATRENLPQIKAMLADAGLTEAAPTDLATSDLFNSLEDFNKEERDTILTNFSNKYSMSPEQALAYINDALATKDRELVITKLKECY